MYNINEKFLHFLWKNQHLTGITYYTENDTQIDVIDPGIHNHDAGPDFLNARIKIDNTLWAGNVELHINASDWIKHKHHKDELYDTVILHVVYFNDCEILRHNNEKIPVAILRFPSLHWKNYEKLQKNEQWIPCEKNLRSIKGIYVNQWKTSLIVEKLQSKMNYQENHFQDLKTDWNALLLRNIFRAFGVPVNTTPFEMLSMLIPFSTILRYKTNIFSIEALLFGSAGMLDLHFPQDKYSESLQMEYKRISREVKNGYVPVHLWKYLRMRPAAFPSIRIALLAALICQRMPTIDFLREFPSTSKLIQEFGVQASDYWIRHYQFGKTSTIKIKKTGIHFSESIIINAIVPFVFFYGKKQNKADFIDYSLHLLEKISAEKNKICTKWSLNGLKIESALESQSLLFLYEHYCKQKRCLDCQFGNKIILDVSIKE